MSNPERYKGYCIYTDNSLGWIAWFAPAPCNENSDFTTVKGQTREEVIEIAQNSINKRIAAEKAEALEENTGACAPVGK